MPFLSAKETLPSHKTPFCVLTGWLSLNSFRLQTFPLKTCFFLSSLQAMFLLAHPMFPNSFHSSGLSAPILLGYTEITAAANTFHMLSPTQSLPSFTTGLVVPSHINKLLEHPHEVGQDNLNKKRAQGCSVVSPKLWKAISGEMCEEGCVDLQYTKIMQTPNFRDSEPNYMWWKLRLKLIKWRTWRKNSSAATDLGWFFFFFLVSLNFSRN